MLLLKRQLAYTGYYLTGLRAYATKVDIKALKKLRELNPAPMSKAKEALLNTNNKIDDALKWLEEDAVKSGAKKAEKVKDRAVSEGAISIQVSQTGSAGAMVELGCETDFVARNSSFVDLASGIAQSAIELAQRTNTSGSAVLANIELSELLSSSMSGGGSRSVSESITEAIGQLGENIVLRRAAAIGSVAIDEHNSGVVVGSYIHGQVSGSSKTAVAGKIGGMVSIRGKVSTVEAKSTLNQLSKRLAQQVVGFAPAYRNMEDKRKSQEMGIVDSRSTEESVLGKQMFLFGGGTVDQVMEKTEVVVKAPMEIEAFSRFERGEDIK